MPQSEGGPFRRILVDHLFHGITRVWWEMAANFQDPQPWTYQLQAGYTGNHNALDWIDVGTPAVNAYRLDDDTRRERAGKRLLTHYRIRLTTPRATYVSNPQSLWGTLSTRDWNLAKEIIRKERLRLDESAGRPGYLLKKMRYGKTNTANTDYLTGDVLDSSHPASWGTAFQVGYHPPVPLQIDFLEERIEEQRGGDNPSSYSSRPAAFGARVISFPDLALEDVWVDARNDQRWYVHSIAVSAGIRGVPLIYHPVELRLIPYNDVIYKIPVTDLSTPVDTEPGNLPTAGSGCVQVDHNYGGEGRLIYRTGDCCGIPGATILAFRKADWDNGLRDPSDAVAASQTTAHGTWAWAMLLDPGEYVLVFEKPGQFGPDVVQLTVDAPETPTGSDTPEPSSASSESVPSNFMGRYSGLSY